MISKIGDFKVLSFFPSPPHMPCDYNDLCKESWQVFGTQKLLGIARRCDLKEPGSLYK